MYSYSSVICALFKTDVSHQYCQQFLRILDADLSWPLCLLDSVVLRRFSKVVSDNFPHIIQWRVVRSGKFTAKLLNTALHPCLNVGGAAEMSPLWLLF